MKTSSGKSFPLGATPYKDGVNFSVYSKDARFLELLLFDSEDAPNASLTITLDAAKHKTFYYWHVYVHGIGPGQVYAWRAHGTHQPDKGFRFDGNKVLVDPYAKAIVGWDNYERKAALGHGDNSQHALRCAVVDTSTYDWEDDRPPARPYSETVIYEMHVAGFTKNPNSGIVVERRGTYAGLVEKIPYLKELGITAVELMPVQQFDPQDAQADLTNYWGYSPISLFAPHYQYSSRKSAAGVLNEFRDMVKALHRAGLEVILDVIFNHSAEGNENGPLLSFAGLDNCTYYILDQSDFSTKNFTGCGNTLRANHPVVSRLILDALRWWADEMHVDGFRFDLASILSRDIFGTPLKRPPILWVIESDPCLAGKKLIAEAWDQAGLYQVGWFVNQGDWFAEWNGPFRDDVRRFVKGDKNSVERLAARIHGSDDIYGSADRDPNRSIQYVTCHDGFTLNDLVSYNQKHNEDNHENNEDGCDFNFSWNCGEEGVTTSAEVNALRTQQIKNFLTILFLAHGTPMLQMGDEIRRTLNGNNNAYCHDSELNWFDWDGLLQHADIHRFTCKIIELTQRLNLFKQKHVLEQKPSDDKPYILWHGVRLNQPRLDHYSHSLAFEMVDPGSGEHLYAALNAYWKSLEFQLPSPGAGSSWVRLVDTSLPTPCDTRLGSGVEGVGELVYEVADRSTVLLMARSLDREPIS